jgi:hypothetical protein
MPIDPILSLFVGAVGAAVTIHVRKKHGPTISRPEDWPEIKRLDSEPGSIAPTLK